MSDKDTIAQLRRELEELRREKEEERREKEEVKARVAQERRELEEAKAREAQERCEKERLQLEHRQTTFLEYLHNYHRHLYNALQLTDTSRSSTGYTKVVGKYYPKRLRPWTNFADVLHPRYFDLIQKIYSQSRPFEPAIATKSYRAGLSRRLAGNEQAVVRFKGVAVEDPVWNILEVLAKHKEAGEEYQYPKFRFANLNLRELT
ncbi:hypothetical protein QBC40DRAFT_347788 [Triangularia verruculosa]|uniref:Uncharacterized protein n=1 Tax=Triangularia verruculosa TaxID=2587418 RepID=A0AAN6XIT1_9PEZI|nr:hypothetical protein QBC40DRAFT_347788 [Triangularia verruculosa]